jgi:hypothetical protein
MRSVSEMILDVVGLDVREHLREHAQLLIRIEAARRERPREDQTAGERGEHEQGRSTKAKSAEDDGIESPRGP